MNSSLRIGLVFETFDTYPRAPGAPVDAAAEYEPIATVEALEGAIRALGHTPLRIGSPYALLDAAYTTRRTPAVRAAWSTVTVPVTHASCVSSGFSTLRGTDAKAAWCTTQSTSDTARATADGSWTFPSISSTSPRM